MSTPDLILHVWAAGIIAWLAFQLSHEEQGWYWVRILLHAGLWPVLAPLRALAATPRVGPRVRAAADRIGKRGA